MPRPALSILIFWLLAVTACSENAPQQNRFQASPELAKEKTAECLMRLEHAIVDRNQEMVEQLADDANCRAASEAHADHVNNGEIAPVSPDDTQGDHHHHH